MEWGESGRVGHMEFQKQNQGLKLEWRIEKYGYEVRILETNMGQGGAGNQSSGTVLC